MVPWHAGASTAQDIWEGNVLVAEIPRVHDAMSAKHVLEQFIVEAGGKTDTTDVIIGYHPRKEQWMLFGRLRWPEYMVGVPDDVEDQMPGSLMRQEHRDFLPRSFGIDVLDIKDTVRLFDPGANKQRYHAAIAELEPTSVSHVMLYRMIPYLLKKDGKVVRHDYNSYKATLHLDIGGLSNVLDRLKSEEDEVDQDSTK
jgi:hypothetical protein